jgi:hypothetical protein
MADLILKWLPLLSLAGTAMLGWAMWSANQRFVNRDQWADHLQQDSATHGDLTGRVIKLEVAVEKAPGHEDLGRLHARIDDISTALATLVGSSGEVKNEVRVIHSILLEMKK